MNYFCPLDHAPLDQDAEYGYSCGRCGGILTTEDVLQLKHAAAVALLSPEGTKDPPASAEACGCPACRAPMTAGRIGRTEVLVYRCFECGWYWFRKGALNTLLRQVQKKSLEQAFSSLPERDRRELAGALAAPPQLLPKLSPVHAVLAALGLPVVSGTARQRTPLLTWCLAVSLIVVYALSSVGEDASARLVTLAYRSDQPSLRTAVQAVFLHRNLVHLLGNVYFLLAFGDGVEQRVSRPVLLGAFVVLGALTLAIQGVTSSQPSVILGASGSIAVLMGACMVLQREAKVTIGLGWIGLTFSVSITTYIVFELLYQSCRALMQVPEVAWIAHISGLALGLLLGFIIRYARQARWSPA